mmetsp:Transcript_27540/g.42340  ORF Transcript_27540/g.42340 Transcript_27540/m.42340 type:complete len:304 (+) Transcript_27540:996-1907(+)
MVDGRKSCNLTNKNVKQGWFKTECIIFDDGLVTQDYHLGSFWVGRQETPVDETTVTQIGVVTFFGCHIEYTLDHVLGIFWVLQKALDGSSEQLQLNCRILFFERFQEGIQKFISVVNTFSVFSNDPDHTSLRQRFVKGVKVVTQRRNDTFVTVWIASEDVLDDNDGFLYHIVNLGLDQFQQNPDATLSCTFQLDCTTSNCGYGFAHKVDIDFGSVFLEFQQDLINVLLRNKLNDNLKFFHLDINWIIIFAKENLDFVLQNVWTLLNNEINVTESHVLNFRFRVQKSYQWWSKFACQVTDSICV